MRKLQENQSQIKVEPETVAIPVQDPYKGRDEQSHDTMLKLIKQVVKSVQKLETRTDNLSEHIQVIENDIYEDVDSGDASNSNVQVNIDELLLSNDNTSDQNT